jgi:hypothetical protein
MTVKNIEKLMKTVQRICAKTILPKNFIFRLDLKGVDFRWVYDAFRRYPITVEESTTKAVVVKGEGAPADILNYLRNAIDVLKNSSCKIERARMKSMDGSYYICVLEDGRVIIDVAQ